MASTGIEIENTKVKLSAKELLFKYVIYLPLFIAALAISLSVAYIYIRYKVPLYNSSISLLIDNDKTQGAADAMEDMVLFKPKANLANEIEVLKSTTLMRDVVKALNSNILYYSEGNFKKSELYPNGLFNLELLAQRDSSAPFSIDIKFDGKGGFKLGKGGDKVYRSGQVFSTGTADIKINVLYPAGINSEYKYYVNWEPVVNTAGVLAGALKISQLNRDASILRIGIETEVPQKGRDVLNQLVKTYNSFTIQNKNKVVDNTIRFIDDRLSLLTSELGSVEQGLENFRRKNEVIDLGSQGGIQFQESRELDQRLMEEEVRLRMIDEIKGYMSSPSRRNTLAPSPLGINDPTLLSMINNFNQIQLEREEKLRTMPEANPAVQVLQGQAEKVRMSILESLTNIRRSSESVRGKILSEYRNVKGQIRSVPAKERQMREIGRQQGIKENLYLFLLQKREESAITIASNIANSYSIDPAVSSWIPVSPNTSNIYRMALLLGFLIPVLIIYLRDLLNDKVTTRADITRATAVPIIGEVAHHEMEERQLVIGSKDRSVISEQFRVIRTNLQFIIGNKPNPVVLVTSSMAGEGKTFSSMNVGAVWAVANKRTVILELDLRKPKISKALNLIHRKGITNYIVGQATKEELAVPVEGSSNLYIVPAGPIPPNPSELLLDPRMGELFTYLQANFDLVVIDSAPVGLVSDAKILSQFADSTLYVVRQRYTLKKQMEFIDDLYTKKTLPNMSLVVNDVKIGGANSYYGYGYGYGYGYSYNSYAYSNAAVQKQKWWQRLMKM
jgi:capsular exopolysaccharide synthesis family protein